MANLFKNKYPLLDSLIYFKGNNWGKTYNESQRKKLADGYDSFISSKHNIDDRIKNYFRSRLHDSWVEKISYQSNLLSITLNEFSSHCFADAISEHFNLNIPHKKRLLPLTLNFLKVKDLSVSWINGNSKILPLNKDKFMSKLSEFLYEEIIVFEKDKIVIGMLFWTGMKGNKSYLLLQVECEDLYVEEAQREAFKLIFNNNYLDLFDLYWAKRQSGMYFDYSTAIELITGRTNKANSADAKSRAAD
jgi:hypothetical protein